VIILDTSVISELMRRKPDPAVVAWVAARPRAMLCTTSINKAEMPPYGIAALPDGRRRTALAAAATAMFTEDLADRVLPSMTARPTATPTSLRTAVART
jgi:predicted nucleic acid-binding protein